MTPTETFTLSLHDALPISLSNSRVQSDTNEEEEKKKKEKTRNETEEGRRSNAHNGPVDRKSTRLNSSHVKISYAVFCLKKKSINKTVKYTLKKNEKYKIG